MDLAKASEKEYITIKEENVRQQGILHDINNLERMLILGEMALNDFPSFEKMMAMPSFLESENIKIGSRNFDHFI